MREDMDAGTKINGRNMENISKEQILRELGHIAFADVRSLLLVEGGALTVADTADLTESQAAAIASVEKGPGGLKVKFYDKLKALELLGKAVGLFDGTMEQKEDNGLLAAILAATSGAEG